MGGERRVRRTTIPSYLRRPKRQVGNAKRILSVDAFEECAPALPNFHGIAPRAPPPMDWVCLTDGAVGIKYPLYSSDNPQLALD